MGRSGTVRPLHAPSRTMSGGEYLLEMAGQDLALDSGLPSHTCGTEPDEPRPRDARGVRYVVVYPAESRTDMSIYHPFPIFGAFKDGSSPITVGLKMQQMFPGRVLLFGPVSPVRDAAMSGVTGPASGRCRNRRVPR